MAQFFLYGVDIDDGLMAALILYFSGFRFRQESRLGPGKSARQVLRRDDIRASRCANGSSITSHGCLFSGLSSSFMTSVGCCLRLLRLRLGNGNGMLSFLFVADASPAAEYVAADDTISHRSPQLVSRRCCHCYARAHFICLWPRFSSLPIEYRLFYASDAILRRRL